MINEEKSNIIKNYITACNNKLTNNAFLNKNSLISTSTTEKMLTKVDFYVDSCNSHKTSVEKIIQYKSALQEKDIVFNVYYNNTSDMFHRYSKFYAIAFYFEKNCFFVATNRIETLRPSQSEIINKTQILCEKLVKSNDVFATLKNNFKHLQIYDKNKFNKNNKVDINTKNIYDKD